MILPEYSIYLTIYFVSLLVTWSTKFWLFEAYSTNSLMRFSMIYEFAMMLLRGVICS